MAEVRFQGVRKQFGAVTVIEQLDLTIEDREFMVLVGPSGCGKSTALRMIAGLEEVSDGTISIGGLVVNDVPPKDRDIAMVFQSYALYPHMTIRENLEFGLKMRRMPRADIDKLVSEAAEILGLTPLLDRRPRQLSGGQRQRVAVGRAIVRKPSVFLFDEPLSNLDAKLRVQMRAEITKLQQRLKTTTVYVTHDQVEAMTMGRRIAIMNDGKLQQVGTPLEVYEKPQNLFVATFIGTPPMNLFQAQVAGGGSTLAAGSFQVPVPEILRETVGSEEGRRVTAGIRPENVLGKGMHARGRTASVKVSVEIVEPLGHEVIAHGRTGEDLLVAKLEPHQAPSMGDETEFVLEVDAVHVFDAETGRRLGA